MADILLHKNDTGSELRATIKDQNQAVVDISSATTLDFILLNPNGTTTTKSASLVNDGTDGKMSYTLASGDLSTPGSWKIQAYVEIGGNFWHTNTERFKVDDNL